MTCDLCSKSEATVHLTEVINNETREIHLCEACAREKGAEAVEQSFAGGLAELLAGLADLSAKLPEGAAVRTIVCSQCGLTYEDFKKSGRLGCGACYESFRRVLAPVLKKIHGSAEHEGRVPPPASAPVKTAAEQARPDLPKLKEQLKTAVETESFEEAAKLRDKIRVIEGKPRRKEKT
jgi:protein arginine kinase activator